MLHINGFNINNTGGDLLNAHEKAQKTYEDLKKRKEQKKEGSDQAYIFMNENICRRVRKAHKKYFK